MSPPEISQVEKIVKGIVRKAKKDDKLSTLTPRIIRQEVEQILSLHNGNLNTKEYKVAIKQAVSEAMAQNSDYEADEFDTSQGNKTTKKRKSVEPDEVQSVGKKPKVITRSSPTQKKRTSNKDSKVYKSASVIPSSDVEEGGDTSIDTHSTLISTKNMKMSDSDNTSKVQEAVNKSSSETVPSKISSEENIYKTESELSTVIDEPPKRTKKSRAKDTESGKKSKETSRNKPKNPAVALSKDEEALKRLKSLVVACGVRKVWKKEFQNLDTPSKQVKHVRGILTDLGMSGRFSLEQAKAIKEKRELAQELEDVQSFAKTVVSGQRPKAKQTQGESNSGEENGDDSEGEAAPARRKNTARMSIMAFLGDESSED